MKEYQSKNIVDILHFSYPLNQVKKIFLSKSLWLAFLFLLFAYPIYRSYHRVLPPDPPALFEIPYFELVRQNGISVSSLDLKGSLYLANFIFTSCESECPMMMSKLLKIQKRLRGMGETVKIVSITVDPAYDTVERMTEYGQKFRINDRIWYLLTGQPSKVLTLIRDGFKSSGFVRADEDLDKNNLEPVYDIAHSSRIFLVDHQSKVRGIYSLDSQVEIDQMLIQVGLLANKYTQHRDYQK
jgi:protein SCO1/2